MQFKIKINTSENCNEIDVIENGLQNYNANASSINEVKPLNIIATGKDKQIYGGAIGRTWGECCELQQFWVDDLYRSNGVGTFILESFEKEAKNRACTLIYLDTFSFQAPLFYQKRGYKEVSRISGFTGGEAKIHMQKILSS